MSALRALVPCDAAVVPQAVAEADWDVRKPIVSRGPAAQHTLRAQSLAGTVLTRVADRAADLVRIASYIYAADQELSRGGRADVYGRDWRRSITLCVPVIDPTFWQQDAITAHLTDVLSYLTEDQWAFHFSAAAAEEQQIALDVREEEVLSHPDVVVLFSGGADSLCATVEAVAERGARPVLVSHRPAAHVDSWQQALVADLQRRLPQWGFPHLSFWIHRRHSDATDSSQRSRAFLFASLGAAVASELGVAEVLLADNGIVSLNLPLNGQLVGALASRSTHPKFISLFNTFVAAVLPRPVHLSNPLQYQTRPEVLEVLARTGQAALLQETNSCSRARGLPRATPHCGYCSQCIDRRFGAIAAGLEEHDLTERYKLDIFIRELPDGEARTVAESYVRFARDIDALSDEGLFDTYPQLVDAIDANDPAVDQTACRLIALLKRHAASVVEVTAAMVSRYRHDLARGILPENCLIRLIVGGTTMSAAPVASSEVADTFRQDGAVWTIIFGGRTIYLRDAKGLQHIARLLAHPEQAFEAIDLAAGHTDAPARTPGDRARRRGLADAGLHVPGRSTREEIADRQTLSALRARLKALDVEYVEAEARKNTARMRQVEEETAQIRTYLGGATGRGGSSRAFADDSERVRKTVSRAIGRSLKAIESAHPPLGRHLHRSLTIGSTCWYRPESPVHWVS